MDFSTIIDQIEFTFFFPLPEQYTSVHISLKLHDAMPVKALTCPKSFLLLRQLMIVDLDGLSQYGERSSVELFFFA